MRRLENRVEILFGNSIAAIEEHDSGVRADFRHGASRDFDLVIGADGLHSTVREIVFGPPDQFEKPLGYYVAAFKVEGYLPRSELVYVSYAMAGRSVSRFALRDGLSMFLFVFGDDWMTEPAPRSAAERKAVLLSVFGDAGWECPRILRAMDRLEEIYFDRVSQVLMDHWSKGRTMLIGDAASCISLLGGEGTGLALIEAYVLAGELDRAGQDYRAAFDRHEKRLRPLIEKKQKSAANFASAFAPKTEAGVWFRNQISKLVAIRPIADLLFARDLKDDFDLPEYAFGPNAEAK